MSNKYIKYDLIMIICGLFMGPLELLILCALPRNIDIPFIKVAFIETLLELAALAVCIRIIIYLIQIPIKNKFEDESKIVKNRNLSLYISLISITISFFILWCIDMRK